MSPVFHPMAISRLANPAGDSATKDPDPHAKTSTSKQMAHLSPGPVPAQSRPCRKGKSYSRSSVRKQKAHPGNPAASKARQGVRKQKLAPAPDVGKQKLPAEKPCAGKESQARPGRALAGREPGMKGVDENERGRQKRR